MQVSDSGTHPSAGGKKDLKRKRGEDGVKIAKCLALPSEIWLRIFDHLTTRMVPTASTFPNPFKPRLAAPKLSSSTHTRDLAAVALTCKWLQSLVLPLLYRLPVLRTVSSLRMFLEAWQHDSSQLVRAIHFRASELGLGYFMECASQLDHVSVEIGRNRRYLDDVLGEIAAYPRRLTIRGHKSTSLDFDDEHRLEHLSRLTHVHFINVPPSPEWISFLVGFPIDASYPSYLQDVIIMDATPSRSLECLRISRLDSDTLEHFHQYVAWRAELQAFHQPPLHRRTRPPTPDFDLFDRQVQAEVEALYNLATNAASLPRFRLLILEPEALSKWPECSRYLTSHLQRASRRGRPSGERNTLYEKIQPPATRRYLPWLNKATRLELAQNLGRHDDILTAPELPNDGREQKRVAGLGAYWRKVELGKLALTELWARSRSGSTLGTAGAQSTELPGVEIRVVAARHDNWNTNAMIKELRCQADNAIYDTEDGEGRTPEGGRPWDESLSPDIGCWADPDVFSLVRTHPWLSYRQVSRTDTGPEFLFWTGELPRETFVDWTASASTSESPRRDHYWIPSLVDVREQALHEQGWRELSELERDGSLA